MRSQVHQCHTRASPCLQRCIFVFVLCWTCNWFGAVEFSAVESVGWAQDVETKPPREPEVEFLLKEFPKGWQHFSSDPSLAFNSTWQLLREPESKDGVLVCLGKPDGYIRTEKEYENFELSLEWKYPTDPNGNSGILLHTVEKDMIWPKSIQVQLHRPSAGSIFPSSGAKLNNPVITKDLSNPVNEWNQCQVTCRDGVISVTLNRHKVGEVSGCLPLKGCVGLQSEGSEIHFRKLWIRPLPVTEKKVSSKGARRQVELRRVAPVEAGLCQTSLFLHGEVFAWTPHSSSPFAGSLCDKMGRPIRNWRQFDRIARRSGLGWGFLETHYQESVVSPEELILRKHLVPPFLPPSF